MAVIMVIASQREFDDPAMDISFTGKTMKVWGAYYAHEPQLFLHITT